MWSDEEIIYSNSKEEISASMIMFGWLLMNAMIFLYMMFHTLGMRTTFLVSRNYDVTTAYHV